MHSVEQAKAHGTVDLSVHGLKDLGQVYYNLSVPELYEHAITRGEGVLSSHGGLMCDTGKSTGRSPKDRFIIDQPSIHEDIDWNNINQPKDQATWDHMRKRVEEYLAGKNVYVSDVFCGAEKEYRIGVRVISEMPFQSLFARNQFISLDQAQDPEEHSPDWVVLNVPKLKADPASDNSRSDVFVLLNLEARMVLVVGTEYAGEIKKGIFSVMSYLMPKAGVMNMHCSANIGANGKSAVFFGLSGTGKTSLSADPERTLIGDDEHGWHDGGLFNYEGGCYAKVIDLSEEGEPQIWQACHTFGTVVENVVFDPASRKIDFADDSKTPNTRCGYDLRIIKNAARDGKGPVPSDVVFLTCDAFGVLPPLSRLTKEQAMYHFLLGYTAKVAGTEVGVVEPQAAFSACFGAPFMMLRPSVYGNMLMERIEKHDCRVWLLNTGWSGGGYGVGERINIKYSRAMLHAALDGKLDEVEHTTDPIFGLSVPSTCPGVPDEMMLPWLGWPERNAYDEAAQKLAGMFTEQFAKYEAGVSDAVKATGPKV
ncbi:phosphoenolpyruvate carboxykinase (ATP) [bacterium]|nr:phosphoenolpyruvate carboxykinase (ATP) [bacterium]